MTRSRFMLAVTLAVVSAVGVISVNISARQEPQFRTATDTVPIYATVLDRDGRLVTDLRREDFEVYDNGRRQSVSTFVNDVQPITVVMMLDRSGSVEIQFKLIEEAAAEFVRNLLPQDKARIGSFSLTVQIDPDSFSSDRDELLTIIRERLQPQGPTPLWSAASTAMTALSNQPGRRVVVIFTDGHDAPLDSQPKVPFDEVRRRAETEDIMVYGVGLVNECAASPGLSLLGSPFKWFQRRPGRGQGGTQGRGAPPRLPPGRIRLPPIPLPIPGGRIPGKPPITTESRIGPDDGCKDQGPDPSLRTLTEVGGGGYFELRRASDLAATFARVAGELHQQYLLAFTAPVRDGALHRLEVRATRPGLTVRARRGYVAPLRE
ncbi:MAG TPA: VWA domain-containing protein [Vicinamibacterales bacterium]|nr:VWA domain-containing protein [Vicinamibacterales bacterium]